MIGKCREIILSFFSYRSYRFFAVSRCSCVDLLCLTHYNIFGIKSKSSTIEVFV